MHVVFTGPVVIALVNTADPAAGVQTAVADTDVAAAEKVAFVRCASCWEPMNERPREHGSPAWRATVTIAEEASWADVPWEAREPYVVREEEMALRSGRCHRPQSRAVSPGQGSTPMPVEIRSPTRLPTLILGTSFRRFPPATS
ncbi:hypothetical protein [Streptosporangium roseum]|uniref:hypothetical protein n=1 Tax=Streptosporangium roseum TaxID=2001 RepID=UPI003330362D